MKGVMSNSRGKETYVVIFRRSFAECSNLWGERSERDDKRRKIGKMESGGEAGLEITGIIDSLLKTQLGKSENPHSAP